MKPLHLCIATLGCVVLVAVAWGAFLMFATHQPSSRSVDSSPNSFLREPNAAKTRSGNEIRVSSQAAQSSLQQAPGYVAALKVSTDYWQLAKETLKRAKAGDSEAQYMMWEIAKLCHTGHAGLMRTRPSLDQMLAVTVNIPVDEVTLAYNRCHKFYSEDASSFGNPTYWLHAAAKAGHPMAQTEAARRIFVQKIGAALVTTGGSSLDEDWAPPIEEDMDPRRLLSAAATGNDPNVLLRMAGLIQQLQTTMSGKDLQLERDAWTFFGVQSGCGLL